MTQKKLIPRILDVLDVLRASESPLSATEVGRRAGVPVQTAHRLLSELADGGLTLQDDAARSWSLGPMAIGLGAAARRQITVASLARPQLEQLAAGTRETVTFTLRDGIFGTYIDIVQSPENLRIVETIGTRLPLTIGASRWAILGALREPERGAVLQELHRAGYLPDVRDAQQRCHEIAERGYALSFGAVTPQSFGISVAVPSRSAPTTSLSVGGPASRIDDARTAAIVEELVAAAARLATVIDRTGGGLVAD